MSSIFNKNRDREYKYTKANNGDTWVHIAKMNGINPKTFYDRIDDGLTPEQAAMIRKIRGVEKRRLIIENIIKAKELGIESLTELYLVKEGNENGVHNRESESEQS